MQEQVILVDEQDNPLGLMEKMECHEKGLLHRAFSVFIWNSDGKMLLQKRAQKKYHSGGLWTNACCSHPRINEDMESACHRRLQEEMGFDCPLQKLFCFTYKAHLPNGLIEHEYDHVFYGIYDGPIDNVNLSEVECANFVDISWLQEDIKVHPHHYTSWFLLAIDRALFFYHRDIENIRAFKAK